MARLKTQSKTCTANQRKRIVLAGKLHGYSVDDLRDMAGGKLHDLSSQQASDLIKKLSGDDLPNPPGQKPSTYKGKAKPGTTRMITADQVEQIINQMGTYFKGDMDAAYKWFKKTYKVDDVRSLATAKRGGEVIYALKTMINRKGLNA